MRSAFGLLESLIALVVFSIVVLVCSQTLLTIQKESKIMKDRQREQSVLFNAVLYIENQLRYALISKTSSQEVEYFEIQKDLFFSSYFDFYLQECDSTQIKKMQDVQFVAFFLPSLQIAKVLSEKQREMVLDRKAECGVIIPLKKKRRIFFEQETLYLDSYPLLKDLKDFKLRWDGRKFEVKLCFDFCLFYEFFKNEIFYAF